MPPIEKHDPLNSNDAGRNFLNFLDQRDAQANTGLRAAQSIIVMDSNMDDRDFFTRGAQEDDSSDRSRFATVAIERVEGLRLVIADANLQTVRRLLDTWMPKLLKRVEDAIPNPVLPRV